MNNYVKAGACSLPVWWGTGAVVTAMGHAISMYRPAEAGFLWANMAAFGSFMYLAKKFNEKQKVEDGMLYHRRRIYHADVEESFRLIQLSFAGAWAMASRWELLTTDMGSGILQYAINWQNQSTSLLTVMQRCLGQVTIHFKDVSDESGAKTEVTYLFDTNVNTIDTRHQYRDMVKQVIARLDHQIPNHEKVKMTEEETTNLNTEYETTDGD